MISGQVIGADPNWPSPVRIVVEDDSQPNRMPLAYRLSGSSRSAFVLDPATGRFSGQLPRGHYTARAVSSERMVGPPKPGGPQIQSTPGVSFEVADADVDLELLFGASGTITSGGEALGHISVALTMNGHGIAASRTNALGQYTMQASETGRVTVGGIVPGSPDDFSWEVELAPGLNTLPNIDLPTGAIEGQLHGQREMMRVPALYRSGESLDGLPFRMSTSVSNGYFRLPFLPDGEYVVTVYYYGRRGGDPEIQVPVTVSGGKAVRGIELGKP